MATRGVRRVGRIALACVAAAGTAFGAARARTIAGDGASAPRAIGQRSPPAGICCCRAYARQGWQYAWMSPSSCAQGSGACVSPDHC